MDGVVIGDANTSGRAIEEDFDEVFAGRQSGGLTIGGGGIQGEDQIRFLLHDIAYSAARGKDTNFGHLEHVAYQGGWLAKLIGQILFQLIEVGGGGAGNDAAIDIHALAVSRYVAPWYMALDVQFEMGDDSEGFGLAFQSADGGSQETTIHLVANNVDVTALFDAKDIPGATYFQVAHGDAKTRAELGVFLNGF